MNASTSRIYTGGVLLAMLSAVGYSAKAVFVKLSFAHGVDPVTLLTLRMLFAAPVFFIAVLFNSKVRNELSELRFLDWFRIVVVGLLGFYVASLFDFWGLQYISAGLERVLLFTYPGIVLLISAVVFSKQVRPVEFLALTFCFVGVVVSFWTELPRSGPHVILGGGLVLACAFSYALYVVGAGRLLRRISVSLLSALCLLLATGAIVLQFLLTKPLATLVQPAEVYVLVGWMALISTVLPTFLLAASISKIGASTAAIVSSVGPASTILLAHFFLGEPITLMQVLGGALVIIGVLMISRAPDEVAESECV